MTILKLMKKYFSSPKFRKFAGKAQFLPFLSRFETIIGIITDNPLHTSMATTLEYTSLPSADLDGISGNIFVPGSDNNDDTLDEPVSTTLVSAYSNCCKL